MTAVIDAASTGVTAELRRLGRTLMRRAAADMPAYCKTSRPGTSNGPVGAVNRQVLIPPRLSSRLPHHTNPVHPRALREGGASRPPTPCFVKRHS